MLFNSVDFAIFLPIVFVLYWGVARSGLRAQNLVIAVASLVFYGWWDWRFLLLIAFSTLVDYLVGIALGRELGPRRRKTLLAVSVIVNLGLLGVFKYFNFFIDNLVAGFSFFGHDLSIGSLNVILPVGISFYTFQTLSYSIDVYRGKLKPTRDFIAFSSFVTFFPQLVAGPIERGTNLLPQFQKVRNFDYNSAVDGLRQILWGLFKKIVIADRCAEIVNEAFSNPDSYSGTVLVFGAVLFAFQIYGDFSGYSDIAIGTSRLFGIRLMRNFSFPYFSRDIAEFWRRWHISLSTWFRDYLYIPLGGSKGGAWSRVRNIFIIFLVSGLWHGANWTFIVWGAINAVCFLPLLLLGKNRVYTDTVAEGRLLPSFGEIFRMALTFGLVVVGWVFFRADNLPSAIHYVVRMFGELTLEAPRVNEVTGEGEVVVMVLFMLGVEWLHRNRMHGLNFPDQKVPVYLRWPLYVALIFMISIFGGNQQDFIYFQF